ncbi:hypothetical protein ACHAWF_013848 [Thalassiosira exigua]
MRCRLAPRSGARKLHDVAKGIRAIRAEASGGFGPRPEAVDRGRRRRRRTESRFAGRRSKREVCRRRPRVLPNVPRDTSESGRHVEIAMTNVLVARGMDNNRQSVFYLVQECLTFTSILPVHGGLSALMQCLALVGIIGLLDDGWRGLDMGKYEGRRTGAISQEAGRGYDRLIGGSGMALFE